MNLITKGFFVALVASVCAQHNQNMWEDRSVIVHLFEWKWTDIADECERFLAPNHFGGVQVSPPSENIIMENRSWLERYQPVSYNLNTRSGDEAAFINMVSRCNAVGVRIYVDAVINHMAMAQVNNIGTGGTTADPDNFDFPGVPYSSADFNSPCLVTGITDIDMVRNCQVAGRPDLNQRMENVRDHIVEYLNRLISLGVAGFRIDSATHIWPEDLEAIYSRLNNLNTAHGFAAGSRAFIYHHVVAVMPQAVSTSEYFHLGAVTEFTFSNHIGATFRGGNQLIHLSNWGDDRGFIPSQYAFVSVDNHEIQRGHGSSNSFILTHTFPKRYIMATAFKLSHPYGKTRIMSSYNIPNNDAGPPQDENGNILSPIINEDGSCGPGWVCEHRWRQIANMIGFRHAIEGTEMHSWWDNGGDQIAYCRGNKGFIAFNNSTWDINGNLQTCLPEGTYCDVIVGSLVDGQCTGTAITVAADGTARIFLPSHSPNGVLALHVNARI